MSNQRAFHRIGSDDLRRMIHTAAGWLEQKKDIVDRMNVFPVPDGDTGTNMALTMRSAERFASKVHTGDIGAVAEQMAYGALMGARGNSGVILSQILSGMSSVLKDKQEADCEIFSKSLEAGAEAAYRAVSNPMEGTILTVIREIGEALTRQQRGLSTLPACLEAGLAAGQLSLERTPELLPVLKQTGVMDAGGQGLLFVLEGMLLGLEGKEIGLEEINYGAIDEGMDTDAFDHFFTSTEEIRYPYCTEFLLQTNAEALNHVIDELRQALDALGDSMLVVGAGETVKVHIHTDRLGEVFGFAARYGEMDDIKINNMRAQHRALQTDQVETVDAEVAVIAVSNGEGFNEIFRSLGVNKVIYGGQTMNPSTEDFLNAIDDLRAKNIFILPNNKNIILTAEQAADLTVGTGVYVIPSRTIPQGIGAMLRYSPMAETNDNLTEMNAGIGDVISGEITTAVRDTMLEGISILEGQKMSIVDGRILSAEETIRAALEQLVHYMSEQDREIITLYSGKDVPESTAKDDLEHLEALFPDLEFEWHDGGQSVYDYLISAE